MFILPYSPSSEGANALKEAIGAKFIKKSKSKFVGGPDKLVVNWGCISRNEEVAKSNLLNKVEAVKKASNKLVTFQTLQGVVDIPEFTTDPEDVEKWLEKGETVFARETLNGRCGDGIEIIESIADWEEYDQQAAQMYTLYIPKKHEYRVHIFLGKVIDIKRKAISPVRRAEGVDFRIRNHAQGFIFAKIELPIDEQIEEQAKRSVEALGLDFGAVDVIYNQYRKKAYVLEVNTAPGIEGTTVTAYTKALNKWKKDNQ